MTKQTRLSTTARMAALAHGTVPARAETAAAPLVPVVKGFDAAFDIGGLTFDKDCVSALKRFLSAGAVVLLRNGEGGSQSAEVSYKKSAAKPVLSALIEHVSGEKGFQLDQDAVNLAGSDGSLDLPGVLPLIKAAGLKAPEEDDF